MFAHQQHLVSLLKNFSCKGQELPRGLEENSGRKRQAGLGAAPGKPGKERGRSVVASS